MNPTELSVLMRRASGGDEAAWNEIVEEYSGLLFSVVRGFRLGEAQTADAVQTSWLRLVEHLDEIRDPVRLPGWLRTTAFRVCLEALRESRRECPLDAEQEVAAPERFYDRDRDRADAPALRQERVTLVRRALSELPERDRSLMTLLVSPTPLSYEQIGTRLAMPVGSIGPTRARILRRLRGALAAADFHDLALG